MFLLLLACQKPTPVPNDSPVDTAPAPLDTTVVLEADQVRAGVVTDAAALFGGISSEGRLGDVKIYNDRAQFVIQQVGESNFYVEYGGNVIDADVVRAEGQPGRDLVDELGVMVGLGRLVDPTEVAVDADGSDGIARVRVEGPTAPMHIITGALENPDLVEDLDLHVITTYELLPGEYAMTVTTTVENREASAVTVQIGDVGIVSFDLGERWSPGVGLDDAGTEAIRMSSVVGRHNELTVGIVGEGVDLEQGTLGQILGGIAASIAGFSDNLEIQAGATASFTRRIGVAKDPALLLAESWTRAGEATQALAGTVVDTQGRTVAGARVHVVDDAGAPLSLAFTDDAGRWSATVPTGEVAVMATGRGDGYLVDLPAGHAQISPYQLDQTDALNTLSRGAEPIAFAEGFGFTPLKVVGDLLSLTAPGTLHVSIADGRPAVVRVDRMDTDADRDARFLPGRPGDAQLYAYVLDGEMDLPLEPGQYHVVVRRGVRDEVWTQDITIESGEALELAASLFAAYTLDGVWLGDPHTHASPSADGGVPMEERLVVMAANGVDIHFGTDHDHVADYRPLLEPIGLDGVLHSVLADECSPVLRGHFNVWPAQILEGPNHGAPLWWFGYEDTAEIFGWMRALAVPGGIIQANHPVGGSGLLSFAEYDPTSGTVGAPDHWSNDFDAMELLNSGDYLEYWDYYLDLTRRGKRVTPVGVSDSHTWTSGTPGLNVTFFDAGLPIADYTDEGLLAVMARHATVVSHGPFIDARMGGTWAPGAELPAGTLNVSIYAPSWMPVETVTLWENGEAVSVVPCEGTAPTPCVTSFELNPFSDAVYVVSAESVTQAMVEAWPGQLAWAATSATYVDVNGDGWVAPYSAIVE